MSKLKDKRAIISAAASGIGRVIAETFVREGARVHICDVDAQLLDKAKQSLPGLTATLADVAQPDQVDRLFDEAETSLGGLDILINNAGIAGPTGPVESLDPEDWAQTMAVNINGQFHCTRRAVPLLKAAGEGAIINLSSAAGRLGYPLRTAYCASKFAVVGFTEALAMELGEFTIRVNALLPGMVKGPRIEAVIRARAQATGVSFDQMERTLLSQMSQHQYVTAQDVANMAIYLASDTGRTISGQSIGVCNNTERLR